ncbi:MAG: penicillin-binding protein [Spirochaetae bacterium HGW-Spirochaetae-3]|jgi:cell division protein FtsI (penicillin-binding protein 3)|nr:MAG: penicillin-binding protein [Spirochaetae bacterium HGW-Spirochaetae-3]
MSIDRRFIRHYIILVAIIIVASATLVRYGRLAFGTDVSPSRSAARVVTIRGPIYDRDGRLLAVDTDLYDVSIWKPSLSGDKVPEFASAIADAVGVDESELTSKMVGDGSDFAYLARRISGDAANAVERAVAAVDMNGIRLDRVSGRVYPERDLAAHLIGFVGTENRGLSGAEAAFDDELAADPEKAKSGYSYGDAVYLTIDADLQFRLEALAGDALEKNSAEAVALVAMEAKTGRILAYVSLPDFDPNDFLASDRSTWTDRVAIYAYEPGSVFKVYSMGSLMALGGIDDRSVFVCDGRYEHVMPSGEEIVIKCLGSHGLVDVTKILEYSCNAGAAYASDTVSTIDFYAKLREFGFGERVGADLTGESPGLIRRPEEWSGRTKPTLAMGQELLVTALQMAGAATVIANEGVLVRPRTLEKIVGSDGSTLDDPQPITVRRVMEANEARTILGSMEAAVLATGTGHRARIDDLRMSVKTGTAQVIDPRTRRYSEDNFIASTIALFPSEEPEYIVYAAIFNPKGSSTYGGRIAAPFVKDVANVIADLYGVARSGSATATHSGRVSVAGVDSVRIGGTMPDLRGLPKRSLTALLSREDIVVEIEGDGWVREQSPAPGTPVEPGSTITLRLE